MTKQIRWFGIVAALMLGIALLMESPVVPPMLGQGLGGGGSTGTKGVAPCKVTSSCASLGLADIDLACGDPTWCAWYWPFSHTMYEETYEAVHCEVYRTCGTVTQFVREYDKNVRTSKKKIGCC